MMLSGHVVVMAVHRDLAEPEIRKLLAEDVQHMVHHDLAICEGVLLRPVDRRDVIVEEVRAFGQVSEILVRKMDKPAFHFLLGLLDVIGPDTRTDAAAAGVQHDPDAIRLVETDLDEVVPGTERCGSS